MDSAQLPCVFGRYVLLHRISRGGMGEIFLARLGEIQGFEKPIVIKKILPQLAQDKEFLQRFVEEAQIAIKLSHGNIVPVYEVGMVDGEYFLALQYIEGRDLRTVLNRCREKNRRMPPDLCLYMVREVANGLAYAHRRTDDAGKLLNLVHCDISPPNILASYDGEVKIIDFGIAKSAMQRAQDNDEVGFGKFGYMAPEQLLRGAVVDRRTDIYSTGVILYELLTGQRVFNFPANVDHRQVAREVTAGHIPPPSERDMKLSDRFDKLVMRALRTEKSERYQSAEELRDEVQQHLYAMNPTISADDLAAFLQVNFHDEIETQRHMLSSLSQTDVEPFRAELNDASSHTVSYALAGGLLTASGGDVRPELRPPAAAGPVAPAPAVAAPARPVQRRTLATRRLSGAEQQAAMGTVEAGELPVSQTLAVPGRRWLYPVLAGVAVLAMGGVAAVVAMHRPGDGSGSAIAGSGSSGLVTRPRPDRAAVRIDAAPVADAAAAVDGAPVDGGPHLSFPPETVHQTEPKDQKVHGKTKKKRPPKKKAEPISPAAVQAKFRQVRTEYLQFQRSYGKLLDGEWQQILFANTYGNMDESKYERLNDMLDDLRRRMKKTRDGG
jgi:eukaryotic-like serine/threonine-protein kinase